MTTRTGTPDTTYALPLDDGRQVAITTDAQGRVTPTTPAEAAVADHHGLGTEAPTKAGKATTRSAPAGPAKEA